MAQNVNPHYEHQSGSSKENDENLSFFSNSHAVSKRLQKEIMTLMTSPDKSISAFPKGESLFDWIGTISGPQDTVYENQKYKLSLQFSKSYPYTAPTVKFITSCFHPNIDGNGNICLDILKDKWSALYDVRTILLSIQALLGEPNIESPLNATAAKLWKNPSKYQKHVLETYKEP